MAFKKRKIPINSSEGSDASVEEGTGSNGSGIGDGQVGETIERDADFSLLEEEGEGEETESSASPEVSGELQQQLDETRQNYLRALADLENYKKRATRERSELIKYQGERVFSDILDIVDNLELAVEHAEADPTKLKEGVQLILKMFHDTLSRWEVRSSPGLMKQFDPNQHSAISRLPSAEHEPGTIINELKKAYFYKDRLLRPAEVVVSVAVEEPEPVQDEEELSGEGQESDLLESVDENQESAPVEEDESKA
jgi:molecular chaperone GrpE